MMSTLNHEVFEMSHFFEVTTDDIVIVAARLGKALSVEQAADILDELDILDAQNAAKYANELDEQTSLVYEEIRKQLKVFFNL